MLIFSETWSSKTTNLNLENFESFSCPRPKCNRKAKRNSGGVIIYYKKSYSKGIELVKLNNKGIIWFKLKKTFLGRIMIYLSVHAIYHQLIQMFIRTKTLFYLNLISMNNLLSI